MASLLTVKFRHATARQLVDGGTAHTYYTAVGKPTAFVSDIAPPDPTDAVQASHIDVYNNMVFGKQILPSDVSMVIRRRDWVAGTVYDAYDHEDGTLFEKTSKFYVVVNEGLSYSVFKCLSNNNGAASLYKPSLYETAADDEFYMTADGYQWKYIYTISKADYDKFATTNYVPISANNDVTANAINGAIETIQIAKDSAGKALVGSRYNAYHSGNIIVARVGGNNQLFTIDSTAASNTDFYKNSVIKITSGPGAGQQRVISDYIVSGGVKRVLVNQPFDPANAPTEDSTYEISPNVVVTGDGENFVGRALINAVSNSVYAVEITNKGQNYTWAEAVVVSNTGIINSASNTYIQADTAKLRVIISPPGGHGYNVETELGATQVCISQTFSTLEAGGKLVANNDFRTISVLRDPLFANVVTTVSMITVGGNFAIGDRVLQPRQSTQGTFYNSATVAAISGSTLTLKNANGVFSVSNTYYGTANAVPTGTDIIYGQVFNEANTVQAWITSVDSNNPGLYIDQTTTLIGTVTSSVPFVEDEMVYQGDHANGHVFFANNTTIKLTDTKGVFNVAETGTSSGMVYGNTSLAAANVTSVILPDLVKGSGEVLYIENITPIARTEGQSETIKVVLEF